MHFPSRLIFKISAVCRNIRKYPPEDLERRCTIYIGRYLRTTQRADFSSMQAPTVSSKRKPRVDKSQRPAKLQRVDTLDTKAADPTIGSRLFSTLRMSLDQNLVLHDGPNVSQKFSNPSDAKAANWLCTHSLPFSSFDVSKDSLVQEFLGSFSPSSKKHFTNQDAFDIHYTLKNDPVGDPRKRIIQMMELPMDTLFETTQKLFVKLWNRDSPRRISESDVDSLTHELIRFRRNSYGAHAIRQGTLAPVSPSEPCAATDTVQAYLKFEKPFDFLMNQFLTFDNIPELVRRLTICGRVIEHWTPRLPDRFIPERHFVHTNLCQ